jgi:hypothetical protein
MRNLLLGAALALASISGCAKDKTESAAKATAEFPAMTVDEVEQGLDAKQLTAVDCNGDRTRKKLGVVPGAIIISDEEAYLVGELPADKTTKLVFYCTDPG